MSSFCADRAVGGRPPVGAAVLLELLADGKVIYQTSCGPSDVEVTADLREWHITSGTGLMIVTSAEQRAASAFVCVKSRRDAWEHSCARITEKVQQQLHRLNDKFDFTNTTTSNLYVLISAVTADFCLNF